MRAVASFRVIAKEQRADGGGVVTLEAPKREDGWWQLMEGAMSGSMELEIPSDLVMDLFPLGDQIYITFANEEAMANSPQRRHGELNPVIEPGIPEAATA